jgi:hypothetical protein
MKEHLACGHFNIFIVNALFRTKFEAIEIRRSSAEFRVNESRMWVGVLHVFRLLSCFKNDILMMKYETFKGMASLFM